MAKCVCVSVWLFAIVVTYSFLSTAFQHQGCCLSKLFFLTITEFFLPLLIIVVFTLRIMWALADRRLMQQSRYNQSLIETCMEVKINMTFLTGLLFEILKKL